MATIQTSYLTDLKLSKTIRKYSIFQPMSNLRTKVTASLSSTCFQGKWRNFWGTCTTLLASRIPKGPSHMSPQCHEALPTCHFRPSLIIHAGNALTDALSSTKMQRTDWTSFPLMLLYHTDFLHKMLLVRIHCKGPLHLWQHGRMETTEREWCVSGSTKKAISLLHQTPWSKESFCFQRILGWPLDSLCFILRWLWVIQTCLGLWDIQALQSVQLLCNKHRHSQVTQTH